MVECGAGFVDAMRETDPRSWWGFNSVPLRTCTQVRLNILFADGSRKGRNPDATGCFAVYAHMVPEGTLPFDLFLGRDGLAQFPVRSYRDASEVKIIMTQGASQPLEVRGFSAF